MWIDQLVLRQTFRIPRPEGTSGDGSGAARRFDAALMAAGFKLSRELLEHLGGLDESAVLDLAGRVLPVVREMAGDHVRHNAYFKDFPANVPGTFEFWADCLRDVVGDAAEEILSRYRINLLALPRYGRYQHTYEEMLAAHDELLAGIGDRVTVLHLGRTAAEEGAELYLRLAGSVTPLSGDESEALKALAGEYADGPQPGKVPVRENLAVVNRARLDAGAPLLVDTVTDVLRLACALSDGDVTLAERTRFVSLKRPVRRALLAALDGVVRDNPGKLADVRARREEWKRLGERLHPHEYPRRPHAAQVFAVARGDMSVPSFAGRFEALAAAGDIAAAAAFGKNAPGVLFRSLDRLLRARPGAPDAVLDAAQDVAGAVSGRVLLSVREHLLNRESGAAQRVFANRLGRGWCGPDTRAPLEPEVIGRLASLIDAEVRRRLPPMGRLLIDPDVLDVALPLSGKAAGDGLGVLPRGSRTPVDGELLRFFIYWRERSTETDFDLSALLLDERYHATRWLSYTSLKVAGGEHSGDITQAPEGASEFINLSLGEIGERFIVPQVNVFDGEGFDDVAESFFGFMMRDAERAGRPFEPRTVRMKSDLRGPGRVALPLVFVRDGGRWGAVWLHLNLLGDPRFNQVEKNRLSTAALVRGIVERRFLTVGHLVDLMDAEDATAWDGESVPEHPVAFIGLQRPEGLHPESQVFTPENLRELIPA
ncbi:TerD family protein [Spirillospora albida]|uniref:TerD family protein n=1 Tax=Spirillospora albida TaxID=58123 RepID=UPI00056BC2B2|nr:TerD family protein [Spirillospora albida]